MSDQKKICIIGAGASGIAALKSCVESGFEATCYEKTDEIGGVWRFREKEIDGVAGVQRSTVSNTSKERMSFSDFPMPKEWPNYLHNKQMVKYFEMFAEHFDLYPRIKFQHSVLKVSTADDYDKTGRWCVKVKRETEPIEEFVETFDGVMIASGHHAYPLMAQFPGQEKFKGQIIHSHSFKSAENYHNKKAVVVGFGSSGCDVAVDLSMVCSETYLVVRRGQWLWQRVSAKGEPFDYQFDKRIYQYISSKLPFNWVCSYYERFLSKRIDHEAYGIKPQHRSLQQHPIINDILPVQLISGAIKIKKNIERFTENGVVFSDDNEVTECDIVVMSTGYSIRFPFLDETIVKVENNKVDLYRQMFSPTMKHANTLAMIGLVQPKGALYPLFEMQSRYFCQLMAGKCHLPSKDLMVQEIEQKKRERESQFYNSPKHTIEVNWTEYMEDIAKDIGVMPNFVKYAITDPQLFIKLIFGTILSFQYRLDGPHSWSGARNAIIDSEDRMRCGLYPHQSRAKKSNSISGFTYLYAIIFTIFIAFIFKIL